jgi:hypothetical protein
MFYHQFKAHNSCFVRPKAFSSIDSKHPSHTQKIDDLPDDLPELDIKDAYCAQWKHVVHLAQEFWKKWREQYLLGLQIECKWTSTEKDLKVGDVVLMRDDQVHRNSCPIAIVEQVYRSEDKCVRKVQIPVEKDRKQYIYPICQLVPLSHQ